MESDNRTKWLVVYSNDYQEILEADDLDMLYRQQKDYDVLMVVRLNSDIYVAEEHS